MSREPTHTAVATLRWKGADYVVHRPAWPNPQFPEYEEYIWVDGNWSCDCNRLMFLEEEYGVLGLPDGFNYFAKDTPFPCGDTIELIDLRYEEGWIDE